MANPEPLYLLLGAAALGGTAYAISRASTTTSSSPPPPPVSSTALTPAQSSALNAALGWVGAFNTNAQAGLTYIATGATGAVETVTPTTAAQALVLSTLSPAQLNALDPFSRWAIAQTLIFWNLQPGPPTSYTTPGSTKTYASPVPTTINQATGQTTVNNPAAGVSGRPAPRALSMRLAATGIDV